MLSNERLYDIMKKLNMLDTDKDKCCCECGVDCEVRTDGQVFDEDVCSDLINTFNFVDTLITTNNLGTIKKFLVVLFTKNRGE